MDQKSQKQGTHSSTGSDAFIAELNALQDSFTFDGPSSLELLREIRYGEKPAKLDPSSN